MKKTRIYALLLAIILIFTPNIKGYAQSINNSLINMDRQSRNIVIGEFIHAIVNNKQQFLYDNTTLFDNNTYDKVKEYIQNNFIHGTIGELIVDYTVPSKSSTGDHVIMANTKIWYDNQSYNKIYLFEIHLNSDGDIYGYNVWTY